MSTNTNTIKLTCGYEDTDFTRVVTISDVDSTAAAVETVRAKVQAVNTSLAGGTDGGLSDFFRSDDYDASEGVGALKEITQAVINEQTVTDLI